MASAVIRENHDAFIVVVIRITLQIEDGPATGDVRCLGAEGDLMPPFSALAAASVMRTRGALEKACFARAPPLL